MRIGLFLLSQLGATNQRNAFSYLQNIVSNHQLEFGGEWQVSSLKRWGFFNKFGSVVKKFESRFDWRI